MKKTGRFLCSLVTVMILITNIAFADDFVKNEEFFNAVKKYIMNNYAGEVTEDELYDSAIKGMFEKLDKHSIYMDKETNESFTESVNGKMYGIGALINVKDGKLNIVEPIEDSPAQKAGIMPGDTIVGIEDERLGEIKDLKEVINKIKGDKGTNVNLTISRNGKEFKVDIKRDEIKIKSVKYRVIEGDVGYIKISQFTTDVEDEVQAAVDELKKQGINKAVLDLRGNPGGSLSAVVEVSKHFVPKGKVVIVRDAKDKVINHYSKGEVAFDKLAVLVDENSASASELLSGAIQDTKSGTLIGKTTYGKGTVQTILPLKNGEGIKLTIAKYYLPSDRSIDGTGVTPDIDCDRYDIDADKLMELDKNTKLSKGDAGLEVLAVQERLEAMGYDITDPKGVYQDSTFKAVEKFQQDTGIYPYGAADLTTLSKINEEFVKYMLSDKMDKQLKKSIEILKK
ncbi:S41 family peptidase [Tepidibacter aestuarii]|uniref:S41 family peptidase n=1 Tax=Tepidibacter aestuarii TaxID=2925782 RepID=UPI0020C16C7B|nr:S41 family peptidase [Tepidibacter aestuarii]CAH2215105.1 carboxyl-terminal processing protease [Tepidibacter aestuarii]